MSSKAPLSQPKSIRPGSAADPPWFKDAVIHELHIRALLDSNGDGVGDLPGLLQQPDHIQDQGATRIWLLPFYPSPLKDDGVRYCRLQYSPHVGPWRNSSFSGGRA